MYIDTHAHLNFQAFQGDFMDAIKRAQDLDVQKIINVGSNIKTSRKAIEIAKENSACFASLGLHPIHVKDEAFNDEFEKIAKMDKVVAIGETGLDYYHDGQNIDAQRELFVKHIKLAQKYSKPLIIHNREAGDDILSILMSINNLPKGVMHCFSENWDYAQVLFSMGFYISFTGIITFSKNTELIKVIENAPLEKIMIETDSPFLTPDPYRGQRNEPAYVIEVAKKIAEIKKIPLNIVAEKTTKNALDLFELK